MEDAYSKLFAWGSKVFGGTSYKKIPFLKNIRNYIAKKARPSVVQIGELRLVTDPVLGMGMEGGVYEVGTSNALLGALKEGDVVINVGADIGYYTCLAAKKVGSKGLVHAFEPNPESFERLKTNVENNHLDNVKLLPYAVADKKGTLSFYPNGPFSTLGFDRFHDRGKVINVETTYLDEMFADKAVAMLFMDAEGSEMKILRGMKKMLEHNKNIQLILEFNPVMITGSGDSPKEFLQALLANGFALYALDDKEGHPPVKISSEELLRAYTPENGLIVSLLCSRNQVA
jgi:FkbM family methyltransferase